MNTQASRRPALDRAVALHNQGALPEAARLYQRVLRESPRAFKPTFLLGLLRVQQGDRADAKRHLRRALEIDPRHADAWFHFAEVLAAEDETAAESAYLEACRQEPPHAMACFKLGLLREKQGRRSESRDAYERALVGRPDFPEALNNLSNLLRAAGASDQAEAALRRAIALQPDFLPAYLNLARLHEIDRHAAPAAWEVLEAAVAACPERAEAHFQLGALAARMGQAEQAVQHYERALALDPDYAEAYNNVGILFLEQGFFEEARTCFERALERQPGLAEAHYNLGNIYSQLEQYDAARASFERAIALRPTFAEPFNGIGLVLSEQGDVAAAAASFRTALEYNARFPEAAANLGAALQRLGQFDDARKQYAASMQMAPSVALSIKAATMLPPIPMSREEIVEVRARLEHEIGMLLAQEGQTDERDLLRYPSTSFYLAYHGMNDRELLSSIAQLYARRCPSLLYRAAAGRPQREAGQAIRIGFVSRFFYAHSVGNFFNPIIAQLAGRPEFDVHLFSVGFHQDATLAQLAAACKEHVVLAPRALDAARAAIEARALDILVYADIGMDPFTYFLSFSRLAPVQCALQGHSETSGVPTVDYFFGSRLTEPTDGQAYYSEKLLLLDTLPMVLPDYEPIAQPLARIELGLPDDVPLYVCPMKLHKIHPDMDMLVAGILAQDPRAVVVFFGDDAKDHWASDVARRIARSAGENARRVRFLPFVKGLNRFRSVLRQADVILDTPHHGGGTTVNLALSTGTPVVTIRGNTARSLGSCAFYDLMGVSGCVAAGVDAYVPLAVRLANDRDLNQATRDAILRNRPRMLRNDAVVDAYARAFRQLAQGEGV